MILWIIIGTKFAPLDQSGGTHIIKKNLLLYYKDNLKNIGIRKESNVSMMYFVKIN